MSLGSSKSRAGDGYARADGSSNGRSNLLFITAFVAGCVFLFWPGWVSSQVPVFRDAYQFYYPQAVWLDQCAQRGEYFPLWQPNEGLGASVPGETTSALFYPLRLLWFIPLLDVAQRFTLVIIMHLAIAALGMIYACSRWQLRCEAGWLAGTAFAFSCPVLFQHNNLVYLCSAAWIGFALAEFGVLVRQTTPRGSNHTCWSAASWLPSRWQVGRSTIISLFTLSGSLALMILAGDPQTAVNCLILFFATAVCIAVYQRSLAWWLTTSSQLASVTVIVIGLSAVQWIPSLLWAGNSQRLVSSSTSSVQQYDVVQVPPELEQRLAHATVARRNTYDFSLPPWHLATTVWPTLAGHYAPANSRIFAFIPAEGRMWQPSLYFGLVPLLLVMGTWRVKELPHRWLLFAAGFAFLASLGNYSLGWLIRELLNVLSFKSLAAQLPADHTSSLYGWLVDYFPGYSMFRYPAKWSVLWIAACSLYAGLALENAFALALLGHNRLKMTIWIASGCGLLTSLGSLSFASVRETIQRWLSPTPHDSWLGAPDLRFGLMQVAIACAIPIGTMFMLKIAQLLSRRIAEDATRSNDRLIRFACYLTLIEMLVAANCWTSFTMPPVIDKGKHVVAPELVWSNIAARGLVAARINDATDGTTQGVTADQVAERELVWRLGKLGLFSGQRNLAAMLSIEPRRVRALRLVLAGWDSLQPDQPELDQALAWVGVNQRLIVSTDSSGKAQLVWKEIEQPRPLCEWAGPGSAKEDEEAISAKHSTHVPIQWNWTRVDQLEITLPRPQLGYVVIHQYNDGGWIANDGIDELLIRSCGAGLFTAIGVNARTERVTLRRSHDPFWSGLATSLATLIFGLIACQKWRPDS